MMKYYYNPEVKLLLVNDTKEKVSVLYGADFNVFEMPLIGKRPPYYTNPRYISYFPAI